MYITRKSLSRRTRPPGRQRGHRAAAAGCDDSGRHGAGGRRPRRRRPRMGFIYFPHGAVMNSWSPKTTGTDFEISPILKPLEPYRSQMTIVSGLRNKGGESADPHGIMAGTWLSCYGTQGPQGRQ